MILPRISPTRPRRAFTLIELLVVIAIIAILAALLFPVFAQARNQRAAACLTNNQRLSQAFYLYAQDYDATSASRPRLLNPYTALGGMTACPNPQPAGPPKFTEAKRIGNDGDDNGDNNANHAAGPGHNRSANMLWHNGAIMPTTITGAIFWGKSWGTYSGDKISGMDLWYQGFNGSHYAMTSDEYTGTNGQVGPMVTYTDHVIDTSAATGGGSTSAILAEVCKMVTSPDPAGNGYYAVYTDVPRGNAGYCAWHSYGSCGGVNVQFAFFFDLDGDPGCDPGDTSGVHSQGLAAIANVSGHELSEARTDPRNGGWYDSSGAENGDKCAWTFGAPLVTFTNGYKWKIQGEWSNSAYTAGTGYPNSSGQKGCLSGF
jgi:prepilin-type N-terminal cleavage/methylation domain-containing protein